jgi:hypothetical protein
MLIEMQASLAQKHDTVILSLSSTHKPYSLAHSLCILYNSKKHYEQDKRNETKL